jgi:hypothetical protein
MILYIHRDASYLSVSNARIHLGGLFFCSDKPPQQDTLIGSILIVASVINNVVASAAESEVGACFHNSQSGAPLRVTLAELDHIQPPTPLRNDNSTAFGILNEKIEQKRSKTMDMRYHWLTDRVHKKQSDAYSRPGRKNLGDYHTKHHSAQHYKSFRFCEVVFNYACSRNPSCTNPSTWGATQLRSGITRVCSVSRQNLNNTTVP